jgi:hypothetical protein
MHMSDIYLTVGIIQKEVKLSIKVRTMNQNDKRPETKLYLRKK